MKRTSVLVLGNSQDINNIDFSRLPNNIITLGVNRIWLKHIPNYFFFNDVDILEELDRFPETVIQLKTKSINFTSDWFTYYAKKKKVSVPSWLRVYNRVNPKKFPDSVTTALQLFSKHYIQSSVCTFYIAGVSLNWSQTSHFWKELNYDSLNSNSESWYSPRFKLMFDNFSGLKNLGFNMVSVTPNSTLNKIIRYENIENLYSKSIKKP
jgi:hypothetical protein